MRQGPSMAYYNKWCDMPPELLEEVADRLDAPSDTWHLRSVCSSWRSAVPPRPRPGQLFPVDDIINFKPGNSNHNDDDDEEESHNDLHHRQNHHLRLAKHTFFHISLPQPESSKTSGWIIKTEEHKPGGFCLFSPFSRTSAQPLLIQHLSHPNNIHFQTPLKLDLANVKVRELGYEYVFHNMIHNGHEDLHNMEHQKVALIKLPDSHRVVGHDHVVACADAYAILSTHDTGKLLLYWSPLKEWSFLDDFTQLGYDDLSIFVNDWSVHYVDVVEYKGVFYAVTNSGRTVAINIGVGVGDETTEVNSLVTVNLLAKSIIGGDKKCLVKSADELLMVDLYTCGMESHKVHAVDIFKLDTQENKWVLVKNLGDRALFLSESSSFSASASALSGCKPNYIYFHFKNFDKEFGCPDSQKDDHDYIDDHESNWTTSDEIGVFNFEKGFHEDNSQDSNLFSWPPPSWITWTA